MKKIITLVLGLFIGIGLYAQTPVQIVSNIAMVPLFDMTNTTADSMYYSFEIGNYNNFALDLNLSGGVSCKAYASLDGAMSDTSEVNWANFNTDLFGADSIYNQHVIRYENAIPLHKVLLKFRFEDDTNRIIGILKKTN